MVADRQGTEGKPETWARWEEAYFITTWQAAEALSGDPHRKLRPRGLVDRVPASQLWAALGGALEEIEADGKLAVLPPIMGEPGTLPCDQNE